MGIRARRNGFSARAGRFPCDSEIIPRVDRPLKSLLGACITWNSPLPELAPNPQQTSRPRGWGLVAAGFLLLALAIVVIYTGRAAFSSPLAMVVVATIGIAALILQLRLRQRSQKTASVPWWVNVPGLVLALATVFADTLRLSANRMMVVALAAVMCFAFSGVVMLRALRKQKT